MSEGVVEPPVEERVVAVGAHGEDVAQEEDEVVVVPAAAVGWLVAGRITHFLNGSPGAVNDD